MTARMLLAILLMALLNLGCSATTSLTAAQGGTALSVKESHSTAAPRTEEYSATSFGNYEFKAASPGFDPLYGVLPLKFNGGYLALDILFFAPAMFFNLREVYPYYEFDMDKRVVRYKKHPSDPWVNYQPSEAESQRAKGHFAGK